MNVVQRQVPPDVADVAEVAKQLAHGRLRLAAVGALEIAVLDQRDRRVNRSPDVIALGIDIEVQVGDRLGLAEEDAYARPARQERGCAEEKPRHERRANCGAERPELRLVEL
jgi:hypothetical protein